MRYGDGVEKIVKFIKDYSPYQDPELIAGFIQKHLDYHTALIISDDSGEISAVCRWNIEDDGKTATVFDLIIRPDRRNTGLIKKILRYALTIWTNLEQLRWQREWKYHDSDKDVWRVHSIKEFKDVNKDRKPLNTSRTDHSVKHR